MVSNTHDVDDEVGPWGRPAFLASAAVIGLIGTLGLVLVFTSKPSVSQRASAPPPTPSPVAVNGGAGGSGCGAQRVDQRVPTIGPATNWVLHGRLAVPTAPDSVGPRETRSGVPACFARSPTGALFATVNAYGMLTVLARRSRREQIAGVRQLIADGAGRQAALRRSSRPGSVDTGATGVQVAGFTIIHYESSRSVIDLVFRVASTAATGYVHAAVTMAWEHDDWKLVLSQAGRPFDSMQAVPDLTGYIPWSGA